MGKMQWERKKKMLSQKKGAYEPVPINETEYNEIFTKLLGERGEYQYLTYYDMVLQ